MGVVLELYVAQRELYDVLHVLFSTGLVWLEGNKSSAVILVAIGFSSQFESLHFVKIFF